MIESPDKSYAYSGLTVILDKKSRFDKVGLLQGWAGDYFDASLIAGGNSRIHRRSIEVRTLESIHTPLLPNTRCILALGEDTLPHFQRGVTLDEQRGSPLYTGGIPVIATYAPQDAFDKRDFFNGEDDDSDDSKDDSRDDKTTHGKTQRKNWRFWMRQDIKKAVRMATSPCTHPQPNIHLWPQLDVVEKLLLETKGVNFYFDIETDRNFQLTCFGFSVDEGRNVYVVPMLQTHENPKRYYYGAEGTARLLRGLTVALHSNIVVVHNSMFDLFVLVWRYHIPICGRVYDTMLAHNRCYIEVEKSLGHVISLYTYLPYHKNEGVFEPHNLAQAQQLYEYNGKDVFALTQVKPEIDKLAERLGAVESVEQANRMIVPYLTMTLQGLNLDLQKIESIVSYHKRCNEQIKRILNIITGVEGINPNSWQQVSKYLYEDLRIKKPAKDPTAAKTLLQLLLRNQVPAIHGILEYRGNQKRISKASLKSKGGEPRYYCGLHLRTTEPRITTSWKLGKTITMRLGSSKLFGWGDNLQNWEKELRKVIRPDKGKVFVQADQSGAEALIVAYLCRKAALRDLFLFNVNPHVFFAMHLFTEEFEAELGFKLSEFVRMPVSQLPQQAQWKEISKCIKASDDWPPERRYYFIAKQGNHSLNYDCKPRAFRLNTLLKSDGAVAMDLTTAEIVVSKRLRLFPEIPSWHLEIVNEAKRTNILRNLFGHPRVVTSLIEEQMYKELYAYKPQSTVGQITNYAITELQERLVAEDLELSNAGVDVMQNNHDSVLAQCWANDNAIQVCGRALQHHLNRKLTSPRGESFEMKTDLQVGENWGEMKPLTLKPL